MAQITVNQAAERLGVSRIRVHQLMQAGRLPATKLGRDWIIDEADLAALVADRKTRRPPGTTSKRRSG